MIRHLKGQSGDNNSNSFENADIDIFVSRDLKGEVL